MDVTPRELRDTEIRSHLRGYHPDDVNDLLERAAATIEAANEKVRILSERLAAAQNESGRSREGEDMLHRIVVHAQRAADDAVADAQTRAREIVEEAEDRSRRLLSDAEAEVKTLIEGERRRVEGEIAALSERRERLNSDVDELEAFESDYRARVVAMLEHDLAMLRERPDSARPERPEMSDMPVPDSPEAIIRRAIEVPAPVPVPSMATESLSTEALSTAALDMSQLSVDAVEPAPPSNGRTLEPLEAIAVPAPIPAEPATDESMIDLFGAESEHAELDDDAFFATLREAVREDTPLGPVDDDRLFDQDSGSFREVFKRRR